MKSLLPILLIILGIFYVITPYNLLPSFIPVIGWIDDIAVTVLMIYYIKYGKLPDFVNRLLGRMPGGTRRNSGHQNGHRNYRYKPGSRAHGYSGEQNPYDVLGVSSNASRDEIHSAYRKLVQQYHPDKVSHLGQEIQDIAAKKFVEIQIAYERLNGKRR